MSHRGSKARAGHAASATANPERIAMIFLAVVTESFFRTAAVQKCLDGLEHLTGQEELPNSIEGRRRSKLIIFPASDDSKLQQIGSQEHQSRITSPKTTTTKAAAAPISSSIRVIH